MKALYSLFLFVLPISLCGCSSLPARYMDVDTGAPINLGDTLKKVEDARHELKEGEEIEVKITAIDRKKRTISVSVRAKESDEESAAVREYAPDSSSGAKLGDILKEHLDTSPEEDTQEEN